MKIPAIFICSISLLALIFFPGCNGAAQQATVTPESSLTPAPTATSTPVPLGFPENPFTIGLVIQTSGESADAAINDLLGFVNNDSGISTAIQVFPGHQELYDALAARKVQAAWLQPLTYIRAHDNNLADAALLTNHFGTYFYGTQFLANAESPFVAYFDPASNQSTADMVTALTQFDGSRPCWVEPGSISGFVLPLGLLGQNNIQVQDGVLAQTYTSVVRALYIKGICDFGVTFSVSGDPRTSSAVLTDLPDAVDRVIVIWRTEAVIPNMNFAISPDVDENLRQAILASLQSYVKSEDGKRNLTMALDNYDVQDLKIVDDSIYDPIRTAVQFSGIDLSRWLGR